MRRGSAWGVFVVALATGCGHSDPPDMQVDATPTASTVAKPSVELGTEMAGDDVFRIGIDVAAGTWHTDGPRTFGDEHFSDGRTVHTQQLPCTWAIGHEKISSGRRLFIPDGDKHEDVAPRDVTLSFGEDLLSENCRTWHYVKPYPTP